MPQADPARGRGPGYETQHKVSQVVSRNEQATCDNKFGFPEPDLSQVLVSFSPPPLPWRSEDLRYIKKAYGKLKFSSTHFGYELLSETSKQKIALLVSKSKFSGKTDGS